MKQAVTREGGHAKRKPKLARERVIENRTASVTVFICETEIPFGPQMSGGSDNAMSSATASIFDMAWWPNGMEVQCPVAVACGLSLGDGHCTFDNPYPNEHPHSR